MFQYLTTVIPFHLDNGPPDNQSLQVLIKSKFYSSTSFAKQIVSIAIDFMKIWLPQTFWIIIWNYIFFVNFSLNFPFLFPVLKAINEDSPTVPTLLTDYILKVLCPT